MKDTQVIREQTAARPAPGAATRERTAPSAAVLALQRTAGNRATGRRLPALRALARSEPPPKQPIDPPGTGWDGLRGDPISRSLNAEQTRMASMYRQWLENNPGAKGEWSAAANSIASKHKGTGQERAALYAELQRQIMQVDRNWYAALQRGADDEWIFRSKPQFARMFVVRPDGTCWAGSQLALSPSIGERLKVDYEHAELFGLHDETKLPAMKKAEAEAFGLDLQANRGAATGTAMIIVLNGLLDAIKGFADAKEQEAIARELEAHSAGIRAHQAKAPHDGAFVRIVTRRTKLPDAPTDGPEKLAFVEVEYGRTESEARTKLDRQRVIAPKGATNEVFASHTQWVEPLAASAAADLRPPFPRVASGGIRGTTLTLQNVKWDADGFDDEDQAQVGFAAEQEVRFSILRLPPRLAGQSVPVEDRAPREGPQVPSVDLDPGTPFADVHAVAVFPENDATRKGFEHAPATALRTSIGGLVNFELVRWIRPEHLRVFDGR